MEDSKKRIYFNSLRESKECFSNTDDRAREIQKESDQIVDLIVKLINQRIKEGYSQREFAEFVGLKQPAVARFEGLTVTPRLDTFLKVASALGFKLELSKKEEPLFSSIISNDDCDSHDYISVRNQENSELNYKNVVHCC